MQRRSIYSRGRIVGIEQEGRVYWNDNAYASLGTSLSALTGARITAFGIDVDLPPLVRIRPRVEPRPRTANGFETFLGWVIIVGAIGALLAYTIYWVVRASVYASGVIWLPVVAVCAPLFLRVFLKQDALEWHRRILNAALRSSIAPPVAYGIARHFDMLANDFGYLPYSLGDVLLASGIITASVTAATRWIVYPAHLRLNKQHPDRPQGHGIGLVALAPRIGTARHARWAVDAALVAMSVTGFCIGGIAEWIGAALAGSLVYTWLCDIVHRERTQQGGKAATANAASDLTTSTSKRSIV